MCFFARVPTGWKVKHMIFNKEISGFDSNTMLSMGARIQEKRIEKGIKAIDFAELMGISKDQLSRIENGRTVCRTEHLYVIAQLLEVSVDYLLFGNELDRVRKEIYTLIEDMNQVDAQKVIQIIKIMKG